MTATAPRVAKIERKTKESDIALESVAANCTSTDCWHRFFPPERDSV